MNRLFAIAALMSLLFLAGVTFAAETYQAPGKNDWSEIQILLSVPSADDIPPVLPDGAGNYHIFHLETASRMLTYVVVDESGSVTADIQVELPHVNDGTILTGIPVNHGLLAVWATCNEGGDWQFYRQTIDFQGNTSACQQLQYQQPTDRSIPEADSFRDVTLLRGTVDSKGLLHLAAEWYGQNKHTLVYMRFDDNHQAQLIKPAGSVIPQYRRKHSGGQIIADGEDNIYILTDNSGHLFLDHYTPDGHRTNHLLARPAWSLERGIAWGASSSVYQARRIGPAMVVDDQGVVHLAYNHLTKYPQLCREIVDVAYIQFRAGEVQEKIISDQQGVAHFPTITNSGDKLYLTWEDPRHGGNELFYSILNTEGEVLSNNNRLTWENAVSRLGIVYGDSQGHLHAFWWRAGGAGQDRLLYKNTVNPVPDSLWLRFGLNPHEPDSSLLEQAVYYSIMTLVASIAQVIANLHLLLIVLAILFILYKINVLDLLLERPWTFYVIVLAFLYPFMPRASNVDSTFPITSGYMLFTWLIGAALSVGLLRAFNVKPNSALNLLLGCLIWITLAAMLQTIPVVPPAFTL